MTNSTFFENSAKSGAVFKLYAPFLPDKVRKAISDRIFNNKQGGNHFYDNN